MINISAEKNRSHYVQRAMKAEAEAFKLRGRVAELERQLMENVQLTEHMLATLGGLYRSVREWQTRGLNKAAKDTIAEVLGE